MADKKLYSDPDAPDPTATEQVEEPERGEWEWGRREPMTWGEAVSDTASRLNLLLNPAEGGLTPAGPLRAAARDAGEVWGQIPQGAKDWAREALQSPWAAALLGPMAPTVAEYMNPEAEAGAALPGVEAPPGMDPNTAMQQPPALRAGPGAMGGNLSLRGARTGYGDAKYAQDALRAMGQQLDTGQIPELPSFTTDPQAAQAVGQESERAIGEIATKAQAQALGDQASDLTMAEIAEQQEEILRAEHEEDLLMMKYPFAPSGTTPEEIRRMQKRAGQGISFAQQTLRKWEEVDPQRYFKRMDTGDRIIAGIALVLGGIGAGLTGGKNAALVNIMAAVDRDVEAQMELVKRRKEEFGARAKRHEGMLDRSLRAKMATIEGAKSVVDMMATKAGVEEHRFRLGLLSQGLEVEKQKAYEGLLQGRMKLKLDTILGHANIGLKKRELAMRASGRGKGKPHAELFNLVQVKAAQSRLAELQKEYNSLDPLAIRWFKGLMTPVMATNVSEYQNKKKIAGRFIYRQILKDRMSNVDAQWAEEALMGSPYEPTAAGNARFDAARQMINDIYQGKLDVLQQYGIVGANPDGTIMIDRDTMKAYFDRVAEMAEGGE